MKSYRNIFLCIIVSLSSHYTFSQRVYVVKGKVTDNKNLPLPYCSVGVLQTTLGATTRRDGTFEIQIPTTKGKIFSLVASHIGMKTLRKEVDFSSNDNSININFILEDLALSLNEVTVNAERSVTNNSNSSFVFDREVIEQVQANSLADVLKLLPGKSVTNPNLQNPNFLTLRSVAQGEHSLNNSFGTSIIIDGSPVSNNANMQTVNVGKFGALSGSGQISAGKGSADFANNGLDLRQISADNIESVEVISGVASVKYGDMTDGAVIVNRKAGKTDWRFNSRFREGTSQFFLDKGFLINDKVGSVNVSLDFLNANDDPRDKIKSYNRISLGLMWTVYKGKNNDFKNTFAVDYNTTLDNTKKDPDDGLETEARFDSKKISISNRTDWRINKVFSRMLSMNFRYTHGFQESFDQRYLNTGVKAITDQITTGTSEGFYIPGNYLSYRLIKGEPITFFGRIENTVQFNISGVLHSLNFGTSVSYSANKGEGQVFDVTKPRFLGSSNANNDRPYSYKNVPQELDFGFYIEDKFDVMIFRKKLDIRGGIRYDVQNGKINYSPRLNSSYSLSDKVNLNIALGSSTKSASLSHRYPGPVYHDIPLIKYYTNNPKENLYLVHTEVINANNDNLSTSQSNTFEIGLAYNDKLFNASVYYYNKASTFGFATQAKYLPLALPVYTYTTSPNQKPVYSASNKLENYPIRYTKITNGLTSQNNGLELVLTTKKIQNLATSFSLTTALVRSASLEDFDEVILLNDDVVKWDKEAVLGIFDNGERVSTSIKSTFTTNTHIPKLALIIGLIGEVNWLDKSEFKGASRFPTGYLNKKFEEIPIPENERNNAEYSHLFATLRDRIPTFQDNVPFIYTNFHLRITKEIKNKIRFSFNAYNVFNYRPTYNNDTNADTIALNQDPTFGAEISIKIK